MLFKTYIDENGQTKIQNKKYNESSNYPYNVIDTTIYPILSAKNLSELSIINHYVKSELIRNITDFDSQNIPSKDIEFDKIDFKSLFNSIFDEGLKSLEKTFYLDDKKKLINRYDGSIISVKKNQKLGLKCLPGYEFIWKEQEEEIKKRFSIHKNGSKKYDIQNAFEVIPYERLAIDVKSQYLDYINIFLRTSDYNINEKEVIRKAFEYIKANDNIVHLENIPELYDEITVIKNNYSERLSHPKSLEKDYILTDKKFEVFNEASLFDFFENEMSSLFYYSYNKKNEKRSSVFSNKDGYNALKEDKHFSKLESVSFLSLNRIAELEKTFNLCENINSYFDHKRHSFRKSDTYLLDRDRSYDKAVPEHQINKLSYEEFLNHYDLEDFPINLCLFSFITEFMNADLKAQLYVNNVIKEFSRGYDKLSLILKTEEDSIYNYASKTVRKVNKQINHPLSVLETLYGSDFTNNEKSMARIALTIHNSNGEKLVDYDFKDDSVFEKLLEDSISLNNSKVFFDFLIEKKILHESKNIFALTKAIDKHFDGKLSQNISLIDAVNKILSDNEKTLKNALHFLPQRKKSKKDKQEVNLSFEEMCEYISKQFIFIAKNKNVSDEKEMINNLEWMHSHLHIKDWVVICSEKEIPKFAGNETYKYSLFNNLNQKTNLLDYYLLKGCNEVVLYLKELGLKPNIYSEITSLECAIVGACDHNLIDWICEELKVTEKTDVKVFGFALMIADHTSVANLNECLMKKPNEYIFSQNYEKRNDNDVLKTMAYVYSKYKVNYNFYQNRLYYLMTDDNKELIRNNLGLDKEKIDKISYGVFARTLLIKEKVKEVKKELKSGRLNFLTDLSCNINDSENKTPSTSSILSLLESYEHHFKYRKEFESDKRINIFIRYLLKNISNEEKKILPSLKTFDGSNLFEWLMKNNIRKYSDVIKELAIEYKEFDMNGGKMEKPMFSTKGNPPEEFKTYKSLYFKDEYEINLFDQILVDIEKIKIEKVIGDGEKGSGKKRRM